MNLLVNVSFLIKKKKKNFKYYFKISSRNHLEVVNLQKIKSKMPSVGLQKKKTEMLANISLNKNKKEIIEF
jgi:hypothetical protein